MFGQVPYPILELSRNLRRSVLRGAPWIYRESLKSPPQRGRAHLAELHDKSGFLAWVMADPHSPLAARVISLKKAPPDLKHLESSISRAFEIRRPLLSSATNAVRWINGEGDFLPGLVVDLYDSVAVLQADGQGPEEFWCQPELYGILSQNPLVKTIVVKPRKSEQLQIPIGELPEDKRITLRENSAKFLVPLKQGQKTGFFLDQRDNRLYSSAFCEGKEVLNLFSYTGGFSVFAGLGGAQHVTSLDSSQGALDISEANWRLNNLPEQNHQMICEDAFKFLAQTRQSWNLIFVDPPSMTHAQAQKDQAIKKYVETFSLALKRLAPRGDIFFSSCSSRISQQDFLDIIDQALSAARRYGQYLHLSSQGPDHPFPHAARELQYLKFAHLRLQD